MPIVVVCTECGRRAGAKDEWAGKRLKCPACGSLISVPAANKPPHENAPPSPTQPAGQAPRAAAVAPPATGQFAASDLFGPDLGPSADPFAGQASPAMTPALGRPPARPKSSGSSKTLWIVLAAVGGVMFLGCAGLVAVMLPAMQRARQLARSNVAQPAAPSPPLASLVVWSADPALTAQLGDEVTFDRYSMRLPKGFTVTPLPDTAAPPGARLQKWGWAGPPSPRGDRHVISAVLVDALSGRMDGTLDQVTSGYLEGVKQGTQGARVDIGVKEKGSLLGKPFMRARYTVAPPGPIEMHSVAYLCIEGNRMMTVLCGCADAEGSEAYRLLETSLLTLREK